MEFISKVRNRYDERSNNAASLIKTQVGAAPDLVAEEVVYYSTCAAKFFNDEPKKQSGRGRPSNTPSIEVLEKLYSYLESENELYTLANLHEKLKEFARTDDVFVPKYIKQTLMDRYGNQIFFAEINGRKNVCFRGAANHIINDKWYKDRKSNIDEEGERIVKTAAKIIKNEFKNFLQTVDSTKYYPAPDDVEKLGRVPKYLILFLSLLIKSEFKVEAIGQCIMKSAMPRLAISPLLLALGIELNHMLGSRWLNIQLLKFGFGESYNEITPFKQTIVANESAEQLLKSYTSEVFVTFIGDVEMGGCHFFYYSTVQSHLLCVWKN